MSEYLKTQKDIINSMIQTYKDYEYSYYSSEIIKKLLNLHTQEFNIGSFKCILVNNDLYIKVNGSVDFKDLKLNVTILKYINNELEKIIKEGDNV